MKKYENFRHTTALITLLCLSLTLSASAFAEQNTLASYSPEQLTTLTENWLNDTLASELSADTEVSVTPLDTRIGDKECANALQFSLPASYNPRQTTVQLSCDSPVAWQLFISAKITEYLDLVVMRQNISPGTVITADMLEIERRERRLVRGNIVQQPAEIIGSKNKRSLSVGQIINLQDLCLVCRGDIVTIEINNSGLSVTATGVVQQDGTLGAIVTVRNQQSGRSIQAEVVGVNQVQVKF
ncbi:flagellar basal body P-ring formation protein FlgA [Alishewanella sp. 16-MA]|uniref:Flagella basal body P-ring formation protein FlgA n=1 Tax=Alishewanella maricola TaxID=2795740 RepID=A0ABS8C6G4_9ALTE|nr:flagellar basal body P-ring formation chaperone FlgA [Alishewanella maricola]MCB5227728.1 flagellar basal body P-ring formation protein FlgA [Alishewanella maricola]